MESIPSDRSTYNTGTGNFPVGRPFGSTYRKLKRKHNKIKELLAKKVSKAEIARLLGCDWNTLHRYIKEQIVLASNVMRNPAI